MAKPETVPHILPISPMTLACPFCRAKPHKDCATAAGGHSVVHVQRIKAAAKGDAARERRREARHSL